MSMAVASSLFAFVAFLNIDTQKHSTETMIKQTFQLEIIFKYSQNNRQHTQRTEVIICVYKNIDSVLIFFIPSKNNLKLL